MIGHRSRPVIVAATVLLVAGTLSGCSGTSGDLQAAAAKQLQLGVLAVSTAAAAGDFAAARPALGTVQADVLAATKAGQVSPARSSEIQAAITRVAADLAAAIKPGAPASTKSPVAPTEPTPSAEPTTTPTATPTQPTAEPTLTPEPTLAPAPEPVPSTEPGPTTAPGSAPDPSTAPVLAP